MTDKFKVTSQMTKKELIEKYSALFDAYKAKADEAQEAQKWRSEAEKLKASKSVEAAKKKNAEITVILRADAHIHYGHVSKIMEACAQANVRNIQIAAIRPMEKKINGKVLQ